MLMDDLQTSQDCPLAGKLGSLMELVFGHYMIAGHHRSMPNQWQSMPVNTNQIDGNPNVD